MCKNYVLFFLLLRLKKDIQQKLKGIVHDRICLNIVKQDCAACIVEENSNWKADLDRAEKFLLSLYNNLIQWPSTLSRLWALYLVKIYLKNKQKYMIILYSCSFFFQYIIICTKFLCKIFESQHYLPSTQLTSPAVYSSAIHCLHLPLCLSFAFNNLISIFTYDTIVASDLISHISSKCTLKL